MNQFFKFILPFFLAFQLSSVAAHEMQKNQYAIGVLAQRGKAHCLKRWYHTAAFLSDVIDDAEFSIVPLTTDEVDGAIKKGEVDFVLINPSLYVEMEEEYNIERIVTLKHAHEGKESSSIGGVVLTRAERDDVRSWRDLKGKSFVAFHEKAFGGWIAVWREFYERGFDPFKDFARITFNHTSEDAVAYAVQDGQFDAGSIRASTFLNMVSEGKVDSDDFKVIDLYDHGQTAGVKDALADFNGMQVSTRLYPEWPLAKTLKTNMDISEKVAMALLSMVPDQMAAVIGGYAGWTVPLNYMSVQDCLKVLSLKPYENYGKITLRGVVNKYKFGIAVLVAIFVWVLILNQRLRISHLKLLKEVAFRLKAEKALLENEGSFRALFENMASGVVVYEVKKSGAEFYIKDMNAAGMRISKVSSKAKVLDKNVLEAFPGVKEMGLFDVFRRVYLTGKPEHLPTSSYKDKRLESWFENYVYKLPSGRLVAVYNDVSEEKKAEELLRRSEERYRIVTEQTGQIVYDYDINAGSIHWAGAIGQVTGFSAAEFQKVDMETWGEMIHPDDRKEALTLLKEAQRRSEYYHIDYRFQRKDQTYCFIEDSGLFICDNKNRSVRMLGTMQDITRRKEIEDTLKTQKEILGNVLTRLPHYIFWKDKELVYTGCNSKFAQLVGCDSPGEVIGKTDEDLDWGIVKKEDISKVESKVLSEGEAVLNVELPMSADGKDVTLLASRVPLRNPREEVVGVLGIFTDITDRKQNEKILQQNLDELKKYYVATIDREERMIDLKKEVNELSEKLNLPPPYDLTFLEGDQDVQNS